jgi:nitrogen fixation/metabolism regulation signal transduction histidine kinase
MFSLQAVHRGIDSWFDVRVEKALDDALLLGRTALDAIKQDLIAKARDMAFELSGTSDRLVVPRLNLLREQYDVAELALFANDGRVIGFSTQEGPETATLLPNPPDEGIRAQVRRGLVYANLDPVGPDDLRLRVAVPVLPDDVAGTPRVLQVLQPLPNRYAKLGESVQSAFAEYEKLVYLRGPLKFGFTLTLSLVALMTILLALWASIVSARRMVAPIRDLAEGTAAVAEGNYRTRLPVPGNDELGVLVRSFNDMTQRIHEAQSQIRRGQREAEIQRTYLETVLAHLSSGVLSFDTRGNLRTRNAAADQILGIALDQGIGNGAHWIGEQNEDLIPFAEILEERMARGLTDWHAEVVLQSEQRRTVLSVRGSRLPGLRGRLGGHVVIFDDISTLIRAQRDAAWAEVARRLAHEIKNPLTPIQLSAERIRHKALGELSDATRDTVDRSTRTIVDQVESLKAMVNAFSSYARPAQMHTAPVAINDLVRDVIDMYRTETLGLDIRLSLQDDLPLLAADPGRLRQVLHNLLINARDAVVGREHAAVHITTALIEEGNYRAIALEVSDNGPGFPEDLLDRLFEPYVTTKEKGTGLGLAIVKKIVEEHNGSLTATNTSEGAVIRIRLPITEPDAESYEPEREQRA